MRLASKQLVWNVCKFIVRYCSKVEAKTTLVDSDLLTNAPHLSNAHNGNFGFQTKFIHLVAFVIHENELLDKKVCHDTFFQILRK